MPKGFDPRCQELADVFLPQGSTKEQSDELAQLIQDTIEDHLNYGSVAGVHSPSVADESDRTRTNISEITRANAEDGEQPDDPEVNSRFTRVVK